TEVGHWEGDPGMGPAGERDCLLTLVERGRASPWWPSYPTGLRLLPTAPHSDSSATAACHSKQSHGTTARNSMDTRRWRKQQAFAATSPTRIIHGNVAAMKTSMACYDSTSPKGVALPTCDNATAMLSRASSTTGPGNDMATRHRSNDSPSYSECCASSVNSPGSIEYILLATQVIPCFFFRSASVNFSDSLAKQK